MKHLAFDDVIDFVSMTRLNKEAVELSTVVNGHIRNCEKCRSLVRSCQMIHDELLRFNISDDFKENIREKYSAGKSENENVTWNQPMLDEFNRDR